VLFSLQHHCALQNFQVSTITAASVKQSLNTPSLQMPVHTVTLQTLGILVCFLSHQYTQLCKFTLSLVLNIASYVKTIFVKMRSDSLIIRNHSHHYIYLSYQHSKCTAGEVCVAQYLRNVTLSVSYFITTAKQLLGHPVYAPQTYFLTNPPNSQTNWNLLQKHKCGDDICLGD